jgi:hypothetical protein
VIPSTPPRAAAAAGSDVRRARSARTHLACGATAVVVVLGAALLVVAPTVLLSSRVQAISATSQPTVRAITVHSPLETVVPSQSSHLDRRLKPTFGVGPASLAQGVPDDVGEQTCDLAPGSSTGRLDDARQTRAPPG